jgi:hypothetical protein
LDAKTAPQGVTIASEFTANTVYASLFRKSPVGLKYTAGLDESTATFLQTVAWQTVQDYYGAAFAKAN